MSDEVGMTAFKMQQQLLKQYKISEIDKAYCIIAQCPNLKQDLNCEGPRICMIKELSETRAIQVLKEVRKYLQGKRIAFQERRKNGSANNRS